MELETELRSTYIDTFRTDVAKHIREIDGAGLVDRVDDNTLILLGLSTLLRLADNGTRPHLNAQDQATRISINRRLVMKNI